MSDSKKRAEKPDPDTGAGAAPDFERTLQELEDLVSRLESGDLSLDQSLQHFKRGVELTRNCQSILDEAQKTIDMLAEQDGASPPADGEPDD